MPLHRNAEEQAAARRGKRQDKGTPLLIRDDGLLMPNMPLIRVQPNMRPYTGDPKASLQDRLNWLKGIGKKRAVLYSPPPDEAFDLNKADLDSLCAFALDEFGLMLDASKPIERLREEVYRYSQTPAIANQLPAGGSGAAPGQHDPGEGDEGDSEGGTPDARGGGGLAAAGGLTQAQHNAGQSATAGQGNTAGRRRRGRAAQE